LNEKPVTEMVEEGLEETSDQSEDPPFNMEEGLFIVFITCLCCFCDFVTIVLHGRAYLF
jgi:hypothetical protein